jgi:16S rRNA (cytidine1402-2'-O)-methyltransferase
MKKASQNPSVDGSQRLRATGGGAELKPTPPRGKSPEESSSASSLAPGLYITATPIGHARDITLRALDVLANCDLVLAEDTRVTSKLFAIHGLSRPLSPYNDHNAAQVRPRLLEKLQKGARIALVSDAGTPLVSDPGFKLVRDAVAAGIAVTAVPGASAALAGLALSALPTDHFVFAGFLPARSGERVRILEDLKGVRASLIFFESAQRLEESLAAMRDVLGPREAAVARELTKLHEEVRRGTLAALADHYEKASTPKGEITIIVGPPADTPPDGRAIDTALQSALAFMPVKPAAEMIAALTGASRKAVYERALQIKNGQHRDE